MVPLCSHRISRVLWYSFVLIGSDFAYETVTLFGPLSSWFGYLSLSSVRLGSVPFARRYLGYRGFFLFLGILRCFSSPGSLPPTYVFSRGYTEFVCMGFPIRRSAVYGIFAPTRSFSQLITSFFASWCLGIRLMLFFFLTFVFSSELSFLSFDKIVLTLLLVFLELICSFHGSFCLFYLLGSDLQEIVDFC